MKKHVNPDPAFPSAHKAPSQGDIILGLLKQRPGKWVAMPRLAALSECLTVHTRIAELRKKGFIIENIQTPRYDDRKRDSFYRLVPAGEVTPPTPPADVIPNERKTLSR